MIDSFSNNKPDTGSDLCDKLTVALCSIDNIDRESLSERNRQRLARAELAIQAAGQIVWTLHGPDAPYQIKDRT